MRLNILRKHFSKALSFLLVAILALGSLSSATAQSGFLDKPATIEKLSDVTGQYDYNALRSQHYNDDLVLENNLLNSEEERYIILDLGGSGLYDYGGGDAFSNFLKTSKGKQKEQEILTAQNRVLDKIDKAGIPYEHKYSYTSVNNAIALKVKVRDISALETIAGVKNVLYSETYAAPESVAISNNANVYSTGIYDSSDIEYQGDGMVVAILDTGLDYTHEAFQTIPTGADIWTKQYVADKLNGTLAMTSLSKGLSVDDVYINPKVPYAYDYGDSDNNVFPSYSSHGTHVAGIVAGRDDSKIVNIETGETFIGVAPNAQLAIMKVFTDDLDSKMLGGADTIDILAALNDCAALGVDVINMSLGSAGGFSDEKSDEYLSQVYGRIEDLGISLVVACGNDASAGYGGGNGTNLASNPDSGIAGSPSTFSAALSVASINGKEAPYMVANSSDTAEGTIAFLTEASDGNGNQLNFIKEIYEKLPEEERTNPLTLRYVVVGGVGRSINYTSTIKRALSDGRTIALVKRGDITFAEKVENAMNNGAFACVIYNNLSGTIRMSLGELEERIPACSIGMDAGKLMVSGADRGIGKVTLSRDYTAGPFMSDFSSWGVTPDLKLKPEITAHGGEITSAVPGGYDEYSGTSMAAPNMSGAVAILRQHVKETYGLTGKALNSRVNQLLMSSARMALNEEGNPYSPRRQGAGLADIASAIAAESFIYVKDGNSQLSKTKLELGDDKNRTGVYEMSFTVKNLSGVPTVYTPKAYVMTETMASDGKTVAEKAYMLNGSEITFKIGGAVANEITIPANGETTLDVKIVLDTESKRYLDANFENGMYIEGFVTLTAKSGAKVSLSVPYLAFYGDWTDAPMFDYTAYEIAESQKDTSIDEEDKLKASAAASVPLGLYDNSKYMMPLGTYLYNMSESDTKIYASDDKAAVSMYDTLSRRTIYELYVIYAGLLRSADTLELTITDTATGELVFSRTDHHVRKSYAAGGANIGAPIRMEINPYEWGMSNNRTYKVAMKGTLDYEGGENPNKNTFAFNFCVDYEAPTISDYRLRFEPYTENKQIKYRIFMDVDVYDNQYAMALLPCYIRDNTLYLLTEFPVPIYSQKGSTTTVSFEVTSFYESHIKTGGFYIGVEDYAMNQTLYQVNAVKATEYPSDIGFACDEKLISTGTKQQNTAGGVNVYNTYSLTLTPNEAYRLNISAAPDGTAATKLEWSVSNNRVKAYEDEIFAVSAGTSVASLKANGLIRAQINITISGDAASKPTLNRLKFLPILNSKYFSDDLSGGSVTLNPNTETQMRVELDPWYCDDVELEWTSSNHQIMTITQDGLLTTHKKGTAYVTVSAKGYDLMSRSLKVTVGSDFYVINYTLYEYYGGPNVVIPDDLNIMYIDHEAFKGNTKIESVKLSNTVRELPKEAFMGCSNLKEVTIPSECTTIMEKAFYGCTSLEKLVLEQFKDKIDETHYDTGTLTLGKSAFENCASLKTIENPERINTAYDRAFANCTALVSVDISGMKVSGAHVFDGCSSLTSVTFADSTQIGTYMFNNCTGLASVDYPLDAVPEGAFAGCKSLTTINFLSNTFTGVGNKAFYGTALTAVTLPEGEYGIGEKAFENCTALASLTLKAGTRVSLDSLMPFAGCAALLEINVATGNPLYASDGGILYNSDKTELKLLPPALGTYVLAPGVTKIGASAFAGRKDIAGFNFDGITQIGAYAFAGSGLTAVNIPNTVQIIGCGAFYGCESLTSVTIGASVSGIADYTFYGCKGLRSLDLPQTVETVGAYAFAGSGITTITLPGVLRIGEFAFNNTRLMSVNAPWISVLGSRSFSDIPTLTSVSLGAVTEMGELVFYGSNNINTVIFGIGSTVVGAGAFMNDSKSTVLTSVTLPDTVKYIGDLAFYNCAGLITINISGVEEIGIASFAGCSALRSLDFSALVTVGAAAFLEASALDEAVLPVATDIGIGAFQNSGLTLIDIPAVEKIGEYAFAYTKLITVHIPATLSQLSYDESWYEIGYGGHPELVEGKKTLTFGNGAFAGITTLTAFTVASGNPVLIAEDGVLYSIVKNGYQLEQFPAAKRMETYTVKNGTVRIGDSSFENVKNVSVVKIPYTVYSIGTYAFYGCSVTEYVFESTTAPVLEATYISPQEVAGDALLTSLFGTGGRQLGSRIFYTNFYGHVAKIIEADRLRDSGDTKYVTPDFGLTVVHPENGVGYDNLIWNGFFTARRVTPYAAQNITLEVIAMIDGLPGSDMIRGILSTGNIDSQKDKIQRITEETVQPVRLKYNMITDDRQLVFIENYAKLLEAEASVRYVKQQLNISSVITELVISKMPDKQRYTEGQQFDSTGMIVTAVYDDFSRVDVTDYSVSKTLMEMGDEVIVISYGNMTADVYVLVSPATTPNPDPGPDDRRCGKAILSMDAPVIIMIVVVLSVFILRKRKEFDR